MQNYAIWTADGKKITVVQGSALDYSKDGFILIRSGNNLVAILPSQGFAVAPN